MTITRYAGSYTGPSYGTFDLQDGMEGFTSLKEAEQRFRERQETGGGTMLPVRYLNLDKDMKIYAESSERVMFPATTPQDTMDLYRVFNGEVAQEPFARLSAGPNGGVVREDF